MIPDVFLLHLHEHAHTDDKLTLTDHKKAQVSEKHTHCPVENLFGAPYQGSLTVVKPPAVAHTAIYNGIYKGDALSTSVCYLRLRGPPLS
nr:hypothetical protein [Pontibacter harenae]